MVSSASSVPFRCCLPWNNFAIWIGTLRVLPSGGRSLWSLNALKRRYFLRSGRTNLLYSSCVWCEPYGLTAWHMLSGKACLQARWLNHALSSSAENSPLEQRVQEMPNESQKKCLNVWVLHIRIPGLEWIIFNATMRFPSLHPALHLIRTDCVSDIH